MPTRSEQNGELQSTEKQLETIGSNDKFFYQSFEYAPLSFQLLDGEGYIIYVNGIWLNLFGYNREEVIGHKFSEFLAAPSREKFANHLPQFIKKGAVKGAEYEMLHKDGYSIFVSVDGKIGWDAQMDSVRSFLFITVVSPFLQLYSKSSSLSSVRSYSKAMNSVKRHRW